MPGKFFDPPRSTVVAGDLVVFRNSDLVSHDVRIAGGLFGSGAMPRFSSWSQHFGRPGGYPFVCTLHAFMSGNLDVVAATLAAAPDGVLAGEPLTLSGRAPAGTASVGVERSIVRRRLARDRRGATPGARRHVRATVPAAEGASYRVTTPAGASPAVTPRVTAQRRRPHRRAPRAPPYERPRPRDAGAARLRRDARAVLALALPLAPRTARQARLARRGHVPAAAGAPLASRAWRCGRHRGGPALARSGVVKLRNGRAARDPDTIAPAPAGGPAATRGRPTTTAAAVTGRSAERPGVHGLVAVHVVAVEHRHPAQRLDAVVALVLVEPPERLGSATSRRWPPRRSGAR